jgi:ribosomal protein L7/L12
MTDLARVIAYQEEFMNEAEIRMHLTRLENRVNYLFQELGLEEKYQAEQTQTASQLGMAEVVALLRMNRKIEAIKLYREMTGTGLKEARDAVDSMEGFI